MIPVNWPDLEANVLRGTLEKLRQAGWVGRSTAGEVRFFQAVAHVRRFKPDAPGGLLRDILVNDRFDLVTIADEDEGDLIRKGMEDRRKALTQLDDPEARFRWLNEQKAKLDEWHAKNLPEAGGGR